MLRNFMCNVARRQPAAYRLNRSFGFQDASASKTTIQQRKLSAARYFEWRCSPHRHSINGSLWRCATTIHNNRTFYSTSKLRSSGEDDDNLHVSGTKSIDCPLSLLKQYTTRIKRSQSWQEAESIKQEMKNKNIEPDVYIYGALIDACARSEKAPEAVSLLNEMENAGITPNKFCYSAAFKASQSWEGVELLLNEMDDAGIPPDVVCYNVAIRASPSWREAELILRMMREKKIKPNEVTYLILIDACARFEMPKKAVSLLNEMDTAGIPPTVICCNAAINACAKVGRWASAMKLLRNMESRNIEPDIKSYSAVISACEKGGGHWEKALELFSEMQNRYGIIPDVTSCNAVISAFEKGGQWEKAIDFLRKMRGKYDLAPDAFSYSAAISACGNGGQQEKAIELFGEMHDKYDIAPDGVIYRAVIKACFDCCKFQQAHKLLQQAQKNLILPSFPVEKSNEWDLHDATLSVACMLLIDALLNVAISVQHGRSQLKDITAITGQGHRTVGDDGPVLQKEVPEFLRLHGGPMITPHETNPGCFLITKESLEQWIDSNDYERFKKLLVD